MAEQDLQATLDRAAKTVATVTAIVGALFTVNTGINAWRSAETAKYTAFRQAVAAEETYWRTLYSDYLSAFDQEAAAREELRRVKLFAVASLAEREVPAFEEHAVPKPLRDTARARFQTLKDALITAVRSPDTSDPEVSRSLVASSFAADSAAPSGRLAAAATVAGKAEPSPIPVRDAPRARISYQTQVLSTGRADGWDVDVFWCQGDGEEANYVAASATGALLGELASSETLLAPGVRLGRIRLRMLPSELQGTDQYPRLGPILVREQSSGELAAGKAVFERIQRPGAPVFRLINGMSRTPWYLSVFVCEPPSTAAAGAPPATAAR